MEYYKNLDLTDINYVNQYGVECTELWEDIPDYNGNYKASNLGRFKSFMPHNGTNERIIRQHVTKKGYLGLGLYRNKARTSFQSHRLVAITYIPNPSNFPEVNHIKANKKDNRVWMIEWNTHEDNIEHAVLNSLMQQGEVSHKSKLTEKEVLEIRSSNLLHRELSEKYNISISNIGSIKNGKSWKHI